MGQMTIRLQTVGTSRPVVQIHDAVGNVVRSLGCTAGAEGAATATWNREDDRGRLVPEGVYFCRYANADVVAVRKVLVAH
jgi:flagellar hook assembly protein FlgD